MSRSIYKGGKVHEALSPHQTHGIRLVRLERKKHGAQIDVSPPDDVAAVATTSAVAIYFFFLLARRPSIAQAFAAQLAKYSTIQSQPPLFRRTLTPLRISLKPSSSAAGAWESGTGSIRRATGDDVLALRGAAFGRRRDEAARDVEARMVAAERAMVCAMMRKCVWGG